MCPARLKAFAVRALDDFQLACKLQLCDLCPASATRQPPRRPGTSCTIRTTSNASTITTTVGFTNIDNSRFPVGTIFFAFLEEGAGAENDVKKVTPFDNNVMIVTPEPGTLSLLSLGLVSIGILVRRRMRHA